MARYSNDPRTITARYEQPCAGCGATIRRGDEGYYYPSVKKLYGSSCGCADRNRRDFEAAAFDEAYGL